MPRIVLLGVVLTAVCVLNSNAAPGPAELVGVYRCDGMNPDGSAYRGVVEIAKVRDTYRVKWTLDDSAVMGVGIYSNNVLAVSYFGGAPAVVVYKVDGTKLVGEWTMGGAEGKTYAETLTRVPEGSISIQPRQQPTPRRRPNRTEPIAGTKSI